MGMTYCSERQGFVHGVILADQSSVDCGGGDCETGYSEEVLDTSSHENWVGDLDLGSLDVGAGSYTLLRRNVVVVGVRHDV